eukprot:478705-Prorocentrum_lima.AAC.1
MTSSLVGSEMCIRDRAPPAGVSGSQDHRVVREGIPAQASSGCAATSVSYTHLTLPTICSV